MVITGAPSCRLRVPFGYPQDEFLSAPHTVDANQDAQDAPADGYCNKQSDLKHQIWNGGFMVSKKILPTFNVFEIGMEP